MNLLQRIRLVSAADPFVPFTIRDSGGMAWHIEARECLTVLGRDATLHAMVRSRPGSREWLHANVRVAEVVSLAWSESRRDEQPLNASGPTDLRDGADGHDPR